MELVSLRCSRDFTPASSYGLGWYKYAIATQWYQFHTTDAWWFSLNIMAKVKPGGHIWGHEIIQYACFSLRGNRTIFGWDIANSTFDLKNQGQGHDENQRKSNQVIYR